MVVPAVTLFFPPLLPMEVVLAATPEQVVQQGGLAVVVVVDTEVGHLAQVAMLVAAVYMLAAVAAAVLEELVVALVAVVKTMVEMVESGSVIPSVVQPFTILVVALGVVLTPEVVVVLKLAELTAQPTVLPILVLEEEETTVPVPQVPVAPVLSSSNMLVVPKESSYGKP